MYILSPLYRSSEIHVSIQSDETSVEYADTIEIHIQVMNTGSTEDDPTGSVILYQNESKAAVVEIDI